jgi:hypothetical protein
LATATAPVVKFLTPLLPGQQRSEELHQWQPGDAHTMTDAGLDRRDDRLEQQHAGDHRVAREVAGKRGVVRRERQVRDVPQTMGS